MIDNKLTEFRKQIDEIDNQILDLIAKRISIVKEVGEYKQENNIPFFDQTRKQEIINNKIYQAKKLDLPIDLVKKLYELIHDYGLKTEEDLK